MKNLVISTLISAATISFTGVQAQPPLSAEEQTAWDLVNGQQGMTVIAPAGTVGSNPNKDLSDEKVITLSDPKTVYDGDLTTFWYDATETASKMEFYLSTYTTIGGVRIYSATTPNEANWLAGAKVSVGATECGTLSKTLFTDLKPNQWHLVKCPDVTTKDKITIEFGATRQKVHEIEILKSKEQDSTAIGIALFADEPAPLAGKVGFACKEVAAPNNGPFSRPACDEELCCGGAYPLTTDANAILDVQIETCQPKSAVTYNHRPSWDKTEEWKFACIEGASTLATASAALVSGYLAMM